MVWTSCNWPATSGCFSQNIASPLALADICSVMLQETMRGEARVGGGNSGSLCPFMTGAMWERSPHQAQDDLWRRHLCVLGTFRRFKSHGTRHGISQKWDPTPFLALPLHVCAAGLEAAKKEIHTGRVIHRGSLWGRFRVGSFSLSLSLSLYLFFSRYFSTWFPCFGTVRLRAGIQTVAADLPAGLGLQHPPVRGTVTALVQ